MKRCRRRWRIVDAHAVLCVLDENKCELEHLMRRTCRVVVCICASWATFSWLMLLRGEQ